MPITRKLVLVGGRSHGIVIGAQLLKRMGLEGGDEVSIELVDDTLIVRKAQASGPPPTAQQLAAASARLEDILRPKDGAHIGDTMQRALVMLREAGRPVHPREAGRLLGFVTHYAKRVLQKCATAGYATELEDGTFAFQVDSFE